MLTSRQVGQSASWQVGKLASRQVGKSISRQVGKSASWQVGKLASRQVGKLESRQVGISISWFVKMWTSQLCKFFNMLLPMSFRTSKMLRTVRTGSRRRRSVNATCCSSRWPTRPTSAAPGSSRGRHRTWLSWK